PDDPAAFPPRPSTACGTCPWVNRCSAGRAALEAMEETPIADEAEARRLAGLLLAGEGRVGRLRERLKQYLGNRPPPDTERPRGRVLPDERPLRREGGCPGRGRCGGGSLASPFGGFPCTEGSIQVSSRPGSRSGPGPNPDPPVVRAPEGEEGGDTR